MENEIKSLLRSFSVDVAVITRSDAMMIRINAKLRDRMPSVGGSNEGTLCSRRWARTF